MNVKERNKLISTAVPTVFDIPNPPKKVTTTRKLPKKSDIPQKRRKTTAQEEVLPQDLPQEPNLTSSLNESDVLLTPKKTELKKKIKCIQNKLKRQKNQDK